jgi:hypothetical protein
MLRRKKGAGGNEAGFVTNCSWSVVVQTVALCSFGRSHIRRGKFVSLHGMKPCREGVELQLRSFVTSTPNEYERSASRPGHFTLRKGSRSTCNWRLGAPNAGGVQDVLQRNGHGTVTDGLTNRCLCLLRK